MYKTLMRETKDLNKWRDKLCLWKRRLGIVKMSVCHKFSTIPITSHRLSTH